jgi:hypothetical protein
MSCLRHHAEPTPQTPSTPFPHLKHGGSKKGNGGERFSGDENGKYTEEARPTEFQAESVRRSSRVRDSGGKQLLAMKDMERETWIQGYK